MGLSDRLQSAWNAFLNKDPTPRRDYGMTYASRPDRMRFTRGNERSIITSVYNRIAIDAAAIDIKHVRVDDEDRFVEVIDDGLNNCLSFEANIDQTGRAFIQDAIQSMFDEGCVALVPIDTDIDPNNTDSYDIITMRTGKIIEWYPRDVRVRVYNDRTGKHEEIVVSKYKTAIIENPFYAVMNEHNSVIQRLTRKLVLLDIIDEQSGSGKLDLIIQLPYVIKTEARRQQAEDRRRDIEKQLSGSKYGIAYTDGTEHITQLNRSVENNLMNQIEYLTNMAYSQLGITTTILDGTADEKTFNNYYNRTIEPILSALTDEIKRKFLTKTARTQGQSIKFFRSPFKLVAATDMAELADKFTRNEIMTSNEIRQLIGMKPSIDPNADQLRNKNINQSDAQATSGIVPTVDAGDPGADMTEEEYQQHLADYDEFDRQLDELEKEANS